MIETLKTNFNYLFFLHVQLGERGSSSVGRAIPCQGIGRRFEPGFPLHVPDKTSTFRETIIGFSIRNKLDKI